MFSGDSRCARFVRARNLEPIRGYQGINLQKRCCSGHGPKGIAMPTMPETTVGVWKLQRILYRQARAWEIVATNGGWNRLPIAASNSNIGSVRLSDVEDSRSNFMAQNFGGLAENVQSANQPQLHAEGESPCRRPDRCVVYRQSNAGTPRQSSSLPARCRCCCAGGAP